MNHGELGVSANTSHNGYLTIVSRVLFLVLFGFFLGVWCTLKRLKNHHQEHEKTVLCVWKKAPEEELLLWQAGGGVRGEGPAETPPWLGSPYCVPLEPMMFTVHMASLGGDLLPHSSEP